MLTYKCTKHRYFEKCVLAQFRLLLSYFKILARANLHCCLLNEIIDIHFLLLLSHDVSPTHPSLPVPWAHWETKSQWQHALLTGIRGKLNVPLILCSLCTESCECQIIVRTPRYPNWKINNNERAGSSPVWLTMGILVNVYTRLQTMP